jgi:hypothetical protein
LTFGYREVKSSFVMPKRLHLAFDVWQVATTQSRSRRQRE